MKDNFAPSRRRVLAATAGAGAALCLPSMVRAQAQWPTKAVRFLVPFAPGGTSEIVARSVAAELTRQLGQSVYVENKPGGAGTVAMQEAAHAAPDGHTIILGHVGTLAVNPYMLSNQPYDVNKDFVPVTLLAKVPNVFVIHPDVPARNFREFVAYARANPGKLNYGSAGNASAGHLAMEYLKLVTGIFVTHIPYRGTGPQLTDLLAGAGRPHPRRQAARHRGRHPAADRGPARRADRGRDGLQGLRDLAVVRHPGARRNAARHRQAAAGGIAQGPEVQRRHRALRDGQRGGRRRPGIRVRRLYRSGAGDLERDRPQGPDQGRLSGTAVE
jgi:hypothetical protein